MLIVKIKRYNKEFTISNKEIFFSLLVGVIVSLVYFNFFYTPVERLYNIECSLTGERMQLNYTELTSSETLCNEPNPYHPDYEEQPIIYPSSFENLSFDHLKTS